MENIANKSALLEQYREIKKKYPDYLLMFGTGDSYLCFNEDAEAASKILKLPLFERPQKELSKITGFNFSMFNSFLINLIKKGYKIAVCDRVVKY